MRRAVALASLLAFAVLVPAASAATFEIVPGSFAVRALNSEGNPETRAGAHPDRLQVDFGLKSEGTSAEALAFDMPPGLSGAPGSVPECPRALVDNEEECPAESQVGTIALRFSGGGEQTLPIFEVEPAPGEILAFGSTPGLGVKLAIELRPTDLGITFEASNLPEASLSGGRIELWGVPADHQSGTSIPRLPLLSLPTRCGSPVFGFRTRSREAGAPWLSTSAESEAPLSGCQGLEFEPGLAVRLGNPRADSPTAARIQLSMPQKSDPDGLAGAQIEDATVDLPEGLTISPAGIAGVAVCSAAQFGLGNSNAAACPSSSRVGSMEMESSLSAQPLVGAVYLGEPTPQERLRMFVAAAGPGGVAIKFVSAMRIDPATGRLSALLANLPQLPIGRLTLSIDGGSAALLASPLTCGTFPALATLESYGGVTAKRSAPVPIGAAPDGSACPGAVPFAPTLATAASDLAAGKPTTISMTLVRRPGEQLTRRFAVSLPTGMSPGLGEIEPCPDAAAASGACPAGSRMGKAVATVGSGSSPVSLSGEVYAAGPYRGAPFSMVLALRAAIGPFDFGTMATRAAMRLDPRTGRATVVTDPFPALVEGLPIRIQSIGLGLDRAGALRNPTSCAPAQFDASAEAAGGAMASAASPYPLRGCRKLKLKPRLSISLSGGRSQLHRGGKPGLHLTAHLRKGDANLRSLRMSLPPALAFGVSGVGEICPRGDAHDGLCSPKSRIGTAVARTSLSDKPLRGSVYVVAPDGPGLPEVAIAIAAQGMQISLGGRMSSRHGRLATNLVGMPDMPLSALTMRLRGGEHGALSLRAEPCSHGHDRLASRLAVEGQNGSKLKRQLKIKARCG